MTAPAGGPGRADQGRRLLDEAVRLIDVVQAVQGGSHLPEGDCRWCPVCRGVAALRELDPDAMTRIASAVGDLAGAVRDLLAPAPGRAPAGSGAGPDGDGSDGDGADGDGSDGDDGGPPGPTVQRIVVTD